MSNYIKSENSELLMELSEQEQEIVAGGCTLPGFENFFFQHKNLTTFAQSATNFTQDSASSSQTTGYQLSQTTLFAFNWPVVNKGKSRRGGAYTPLNTIFNFLQNWGL